MRPGMRILPRPVRHVLICKVHNRYESFCMGHRGVFHRDHIVRYGSSSP